MPVDFNIPTPKPGLEVMAPQWLATLLTNEDKQTRLAEQNAILARTDINTGLPNKRAWEETINSRKHSRHPLAVVILDLDYFKTINDTYGHLKGDECIADAAQLILSSIRPPDDFLANLGGDEFGIIVDASKDDTRATIDIISQRLQQQFDDYNSHNDVKLHFSHGTAISVAKRGQPHDTIKLFHEADMSMYETKQAHHLQDQNSL